MKKQMQLHPLEAMPIFIPTAVHQDSGQSGIHLKNFLSLSVLLFCFIIIEKPQHQADFGDTWQPRIGV